MREATSTVPVKPGLHSYNFNRRTAVREAEPRFLKYLRIVLIVCGVSGLGYYGYTVADQDVYQAYENWSFDRHMAGHAATFNDWLRERTPLGTFMKPAAPTEAVTAPGTPRTQPSIPSPPLLEEGALLGRVSIGRLNLSAIVRQGVDAATLSRAVGHVPSTALPGQAGNFAIAAHRDTLFRGLKDIKQGDDVTFQSAGGHYTYRVVSTQIVLPSNVGVLKPPAAGEWLTMITCYPFYYVGSAPKRFIVQAKLVSTDAGSSISDGGDVAAIQPKQGPSPPRVRRSAAVHAPAKRSFNKQVSMKQPRRERGFSLLSRTAKRSSADEDVPERPKKKRGFWHRLFHRDSG